MRNIALGLVVAAGLGVTAGCVVEGRLSPAEARVEGEAWVRTEVFFGLRRIDRTEIGEAEWEKFLADEVTPRFPAGLSVVDSYGQYRDRAGLLVREPSKLVVLVYPASEAAAADAKIDAITKRYCERFEQESVLRLDSPAGVTFPTASE